MVVQLCGNTLTFTELYVLNEWHLCCVAFINKTCIPLKKKKKKTVVIQSLRHVWLFTACKASLSFTIFWRLLKLMSIDSVMPSNHLILCCPLLLPSVFPSIKVFSSELALCIWWPKYWRFSLIINPSNEYLGLISFRIDWFDHAVQRILKSLLQHRNSKASILWCPAIFKVQLSYWYMTTKNP